MNIFNTEISGSSIAIAILIGVPLIIGLVKIPFLLWVATFFALIFGFINLLVYAGFVGGWYLFFSLLWEMIWIAIGFIPAQRKMWTTRIN